jgi:hypothetical protein
MIRGVELGLGGNKVAWPEELDAEEELSAAGIGGTGGGGGGLGGGLG